MMSPLKSVETASDEILQTQDRLNCPGELQAFMESPDVKKQMNKAYLYINSKALVRESGQSIYNYSVASESTPKHQFFTPQWKSTVSEVNNPVEEGEIAESSNHGDDNI